MRGRGGSCIWGLAALTLLACVALLMASAPAFAYTNTECLGCHGIGQTASSQVDFVVGTVDRTRCSTCHGWLGHAAFKTDPYSWTPDALHLAHRTTANAGYGTPGATDGRGCQGCHYQAACSACHGDVVPHTDHTYDESAAAYVYPPVVITQSTGFLPGQNADAAAVTGPSTCANPSCHAMLDAGFTARPACESCHETHGGPSHVYEAFSPTCQRSGCHPAADTLETLHQAYADAQSLPNVCSVCHNAQNVSNGKTADCFDCHSSAGPAQPFAATHPYEPPTHEATSTSCLGVGCHASQVPSNHTTTTAAGPNDCERCHRVANPTVGLSPKSCPACHPTNAPDHAYSMPGVPAKHITSWNVSSCIAAGCHHSANLWDEHAPRTPAGGGPFECATCHGSADPAVAAAIETNDTACSACHAGVTTQGHYAAHEATPPISQPGAYGPVNSCQNCHRNNLVDQHVGYVGWDGQVFDCATCHESSDLAVQGAIQAGSTRCDACHTLHGDPIALHETTTSASGTDCGGCHYSNLGSEHSARGLGCSSCHDSTQTAVRASIELGNKYCGACHTTYHDAAVAKHTATSTASVDGCGACHDHVVSGAIDVTSMHAGVTSPGACSVCHSNPSRIPDLAAKTAECASCHATQGSDYHRLMTSGHTYADMSPTCISAGCHAANTLPEAHEPYMSRYPAYADTCALCHRNADPGRVDWDTATAACSSCHAVHGDLNVLHQAPDSSACVDCHETADVRVIHAEDPEDSCAVCHDGSPLPASTKCINCHGDLSPPDPAHYGTTTHTAVQANGCSNCHFMEMKPEHAKPTAGPVGCVTCHEARVDAFTAAWDKTCDACHATRHGDQNARHVSTRTTCRGAACHVIADVSSQSAAANMHTTCQRCHSTAKYPASTDCLSSGCHPAKPADHAWDTATQSRHVTTWTVTGCISGGCHTSSNLWTEHQARTPSAGGSFSCATCHDGAAAYQTAITNRRTGCDACHPGASMEGHHPQHDASGTIDPGCKGCHFPYLDDEHVKLGYTCATCHDSDNTAVRDAIADGVRDCSACHPAVNGRDRHASQDSTEFVAGNASGHNAYPGLSWMRSSWKIGSTTYTWPLPSATSFLKTGWTTSSMVTCDKCHTYNAATASGPHGSTVKVNIDPSFPTSYATVYLSRTSNGMSSSTVLCAKCHDLNGTTGTFSNKAHDEGDHQSSSRGKCVNCHARLPHAWRLPRLLAYTTDPAPYRTATNGLTQLKLRSHSGPSDWQESDCYAGCAGDHDRTVSPEWPSQIQQYGNLSGNVKSSSGSNLSGVTVSTSSGGYSTSTDANGNYTLAGVSVGSYTLSASLTGYDTASQSVAVNNEQTTTADFTLSPATTPSNLALNKTATASSTKSSSSYPASKAVDGSNSTRWQSNGSSTEWLKVDLGSSRSVSKVVVDWYGSYYARTYRVEVSTDNSNWTSVYSTTSGTSGTKTHTFSSRSARYVRVYMTRANSSSGYSIREFEVYQ